MTNIYEWLMPQCQRAKGYGFIKYQMIFDELRDKQNRI